MRRVALTAMGLVAMVGVAAAAPGEVGDCARCHVDQVALFAKHGGHAGVLECQDCHLDRRPGRIGRRHRTITACSVCHDEVRHPTSPRKGPHATRGCLPCHEPHGSANAQLVKPQIVTGRRVKAISFADAGGAVPGGFVSPDASGTGLCEVCHRTTQYWRADGRGEPHFTDECSLCHAHDAGFGVAIGEDSCGICHEPQAQRFTLPSAHSTRFACADCHEARQPTPGPGHRAVTPCQSCHDTATHAPAGVGALPCAQCHEPHGTTNGWLVLETIATTAGASRPIVFDGLLGRADGSFASASAPGSGICEICHTTTRYYRADGTGEQHFTVSCLPCHRHSEGFAPQ